MEIRLKKRLIKLLLGLLIQVIVAHSVYAQKRDPARGRGRTNTDTVSVIGADSLIKNADTLVFVTSGGFMLDSLAQDSLYRIRKDSLRRDSLMKVSPKAVVNISARKRVFVPLPEGMVLTVTDSALVGAKHYLAIEKYFKSTFKQLLKKTLMSVKIGPRNYRTVAFIRSLPLLQAEFQEQKEQRFISKSEIDAYQKRQKEYFSTTVEIIVDIRSLYIACTELSEEMFTIKLSSNEIMVEPLEIQLQPLYSMVTEFIPWYQRRVLLKFPRKVNNIDLWDNRSLVLLINLKDLRTFTDPKYQVDFRFDLNPENKIDPEKVILESN